MTAQMDPVSIKGIHHFAYKCRDAAETRAFYEDILGLPLVMVLEVNDVTTTTGERLSFIHFFFEMADGNYVAFFDFGDGVASQLDPKTPKFSHHLAFKLDTPEEFVRAEAHLKKHGIPYQGPLEHDFVRSLYFWDPNGVRLEYAYTFATPKQMASFKEDASAALERWVAKVKGSELRIAEAV